MQEVAIATTSRARGVATTSVAVSTPRITEIQGQVATRTSTNISEFDRVLGGGFVSGSVILLAGEPGVGKSTLLLSLASQLAVDGPVLYITGEESAGQVRLRAERTDAVHSNIFLAAETDLDTALSHAENVQAKVVIVDSVQTLIAGGNEGITGGVSQVKTVTAALSSFAKARNTTVILVGHVTKDGSIAGPRTLEHLVDVVLHFEGDKNSTIRLIRGVKNRYGAADEVGCFEQREEGIFPIDDPTMMFLQHRESMVPGTAITVSMDGKRPLMAEVQALVAPTNNPSPRRAVSGLDNARIAMILAVLDRRCKVPVGTSDVYAATVGGVRLTEPSVDLAVALAAASAVFDRAILDGLVVLGEVGLAGEVRAVRGIERRLAEAHRLGFSGAIVPLATDAQPYKTPKGFRIFSVGKVQEALKVGLRLGSDS